MKENLSPEEKLLSLIKGHKKQDVAQPAISSITPAVKEANVKTDFKSSLISSTQKYFSFLGIKKIILVALVASCLYLAISFIYPIFGLKVTLPKITPEKVTEEKIEAKDETKSSDYYLEGTQRQIFTSPANQEAEKPAAAESADMIKDITLVGILAGDNPQAIIEDKKTQKTSYVTKGQFIGELQVEDIQEGKVILNYKGQKLELYL